MDLNILIVSLDPLSILWIKEPKISKDLRTAGYMINGNDVRH